jgi:DNA-directed RNA polymerase specialized sigma24 family protein
VSRVKHIGDSRKSDFPVFAGGAARRLLHIALLLTGREEEARQILCRALARTYRDWDRLQVADPYAHTRSDIITSYAFRQAMGRLLCRRNVHPDNRGVLGRLNPRQRLVLLLRLHEGLSEEETAAQLGLAVDTVRATEARACSIMRGHGFGLAFAGDAR